jgi:hypothetical protein
MQFQLTFYALQLLFTLTIILYCIVLEVCFFKLSKIRVGFVENLQSFKVHLGLEKA